MRKRATASVLAIAAGIGIGTAVQAVAGEAPTQVRFALTALCAVVACGAVFQRLTVKPRPSRRGRR